MPLPATLDRLIHPSEKTALYIDGANLYSAARSLGFDMDYRRLLELFKSKGRLVRAHYYTALIEDQEFSPIRPLVDWLDYNGYSLITKPAREYTDQMGRRRFKGDMDVDIAVDMMEAAAFIDHAFLFSGDGDFTSLVAAVQRKGMRVTVVSSVRSNPPIAADELRRQADGFVDLVDIADAIGRPPRPQPAQHQYDDDDEDEDEDL